MTVKEKTATSSAKGGSVSMIDKMRNQANDLKKKQQGTGEREILVPLDKLRFDPTQPRSGLHPIDSQIDKNLEAYIEELAESIKEQELIEAITVREMPDGTYMVVVGECRTRAHLLLGKTTIRAIVRNDLTNSSLKLAYQLTENIARKDLSDQEIAESIKRLMAGDEANGVPKMNQVQIGKKLGKKSESWVSKYVKFGDDEIQRVWVKTGIADTVEKTYRLSVLPVAVQTEIIRRTSLPKTDPQHLEKPLNREVIDQIAKEAKEAKRQPHVPVAPAAPTTLGVSKPAAVPAGGVGTRTHEPVWPFPTPGGPESGSEQPQEKPGAGARQNSDDNGVSKQTGVKQHGYQLPPGAREQILLSTPATDAVGTPPVHCQVTTRNIAGLLALLEEQLEESDQFDAALAIHCEMMIPGELAKVIVNKLAGYIVPDQEVPAVIQSHLSDLEIPSVK